MELPYAAGIQASIHMGHRPLFILYSINLWSELFCSLNCSSIGLQEVVQFGSCVFLTCSPFSLPLFLPSSHPPVFPRLFFPSPPLALLYFLVLQDNVSFYSISFSKIQRSLGFFYERMIVKNHVWGAGCACCCWTGYASGLSVVRAMRYVCVHEPPAHNHPSTCIHAG